MPLSCSEGKRSLLSYRDFATVLDYDRVLKSSYAMVSLRLWSWGPLKDEDDSLGLPADQLLLP